MTDKAKTYLHYAGATFLFILSIVAIIATFVFFFKPDYSKQTHSISVEASSEITAKPDIANFSFSVKEMAKNPKEAQKVINKKISSILSELKSLGIEEKDIKTESYTINPRYEWVKTDKRSELSPEGIVYYPDRNRKRILIGYEVRQNVSLKVRDFKKIPNILELLAKNGVENLYGPNFQIEDPDGLKEKAKLEAIKKAKKKAENIARELGLKLGKVISFNEGNNYYPIYRDAMPTMALKSAGIEEDASPELPAGENKVRSSVRITYEVK